MRECIVYLLVGADGNHVASNDQEQLVDKWDEEVGESLAGSRIIQLTVNVPDDEPTVVHLEVAARPQIV